MQNLKILTQNSFVSMLGGVVLSIICSTYVFGMSPDRPLLHVDPSTGEMPGCQGNRDIRDQLHEIFGGGRVDPIAQRIAIRMNLEEKLKASGDDEERKRWKKILDSLSVNTATIVARGLAGDKNADALIGFDIGDNIGKGILNGISLRAASALGDVLHGRIKGVLEDTVGVAWDRGFEGLLSAGSFVNNELFHGGHEPFVPEKIKALRGFVKASFDDVERLLRDGLRDSLRGYDMPLRPSGGQVQGSLGVSPSPEKLEDTAPQQLSKNEDLAKLLDPWKHLMQAYVEQFKKFSQEIDLRKYHYCEDDLVVFYAEQIQEQLDHVCQLLSKSKTLAELDELFGASKVMVMAIKQNVDRLFQGLEELIKPRSYQKDGLLSSSYDLRSSAPKKDPVSDGFGLSSPWTGAQ